MLCSVESVATTKAMGPNHSWPMAGLPAWADSSSGDAHAGVLELRVDQRLAVGQHRQAQRAAFSMRSTTPSFWIAPVSSTARAASAVVFSSAAARAPATSSKLTRPSGVWIPSRGT